MPKLWSSVFINEKTYLKIFAIKEKSNYYHNQNFLNEWTKRFAILPFILPFLISLNAIPIPFCLFFSRSFFFFSSISISAHPAQFNFGACILILSVKTSQIHYYERSNIFCSMKIREVLPGARKSFFIKRRAFGCRLFVVMGFDLYIN